MNLFKQLHMSERMARWKKRFGKAVTLILELCLVGGVFALLIWGSKSVIQNSTRSGHAVWGWIGVIMGWMVLFAFGQTASSSIGRDKDNPQGNLDIPDEHA